MMKLALFAAAVALLIGCDVLEREDPPVINWEKTYGAGFYTCQAGKVLPAGDGGFFIAATCQTAQSQSLMWLIRTDSLGDTLWTRTFPVRDSADTSYCVCTCRDVMRMADGGLLLLSTLQDTGDYYRPSVFLVRLDAAGDTFWTRETLFEPEINVFALAEGADGGFFVATSPAYGGYNPAQVLALDSLGAVRWVKSYWDSCYTDYDVAIVGTGDGGFVLATSTSEPYPVGGQTRATLVRCDAYGNPVWVSRSAVNGYVWLRDIAPTADSGFIVGGTHDVWQVRPSHFHQYFYLLKVASNGALEWERSWGEPEYNEIRAICATDDDGYAFAGPTSGGYGPCVGKVDDDGQQKWKLSVGGWNATLADIATLTDGGWVVTGTTTAAPATNQLIYLARLSPAR
jgi:hypothetical protein